MEKGKERLVSGTVFRPESITELKEIIVKYNFDINKINIKEMTERLEDSIYYNKYYVGLDYKNKEIRQIGITDGCNNFESYYQNYKLKSAGTIIEE